jgi:curved DNA-binding protein CbpA
MLEADPYAILGIKPSATPIEIKHAYRLLARKYHPDVSDAVDAEERFKQINQAYKVLSSPVERSNYDFRQRHTYSPTAQPHARQSTEQPRRSSSTHKHEHHAHAHDTWQKQARPHARRATKPKPKRPWWNPDLRGWWVKRQVHWENANPVMKWFATGMLTLVLVINLLVVLPILFGHEADPPVAVITYPSASSFSR